MRTLEEINEDTILEDIRDLLKRFNESLITRVDPAGLTLKSTVPFKVLSLKEILFHRITHIAEVALDLYDQKNRVPSYILMRSTVETCALCFTLRKKCDTFLKDFDIDEFDNFLMKGITGGRDDKATHESVNVLTCIDHVDKEFKNFRNMYDVLCEYAHPNYLGTLDSFGKYDKDNVWLDLGKESKMPPAQFGLAPFFMSLLIFEEQYNSVAGILNDINEYFEKNDT